MKKVFLCCWLFFLVGGIVQANEWYAVTGISGQDNNWYNPLNWSWEMVPAAETVEWRYATDDGAYKSLVINGGSATSGASTCGIWYDGTASLKVTNAATYAISGGLNLYNSVLSGAPRTSNSVFTVNGGSTVSVSADSQIGRTWGLHTAASSATINIDGPGTKFTQTGYMWLGWGAGKTENTTFSVTNGAVAQFNTAAGLYIQQDGTKVKISVNNGLIKVAGNREGQYGGYKTNGWLVGWDGTPASVTIAYHAQDNFTYITSVPEPITFGLLGLGFVALRWRKR